MEVAKRYFDGAIKTPIEKFVKNSHNEMEETFQKHYQLKCRTLIEDYKRIVEVENKEKMNEYIYVLEYMQENYMKQEKETDEKMLKLKKKCECYQKMLPDNVCYDKCYGCHGIWFEGKGPKRCEQCKMVRRL